MSVYFAKADRYIKIGYSADPVARSSTVTRNGARPDDLPRAAKADLLGWIPGDRGREKELHDKFADRRAAGEWFRVSADEARDLIWSDPFGVDLDRMSMKAVLVALKYPHLTRDQIESAGIPIEAVPIEEALLAIDSYMSGGAR